MTKSMRTESDEMEIEGFLTSLEWDDDDEPTELAIITDDDIEYVLEMGRHSAELIRHTERYVVARGTLRKNGSGWDVFRVSWFEAEEDFDADDFEADDLAEDDFVDDDFAVGADY